MKFFAKLDKACHNFYSRLLGLQKTDKSNHEKLLNTAIDYASKKTPMPNIKLERPSSSLRCFFSPFCVREVK